jgi:hypothetical protein
MTASSSTKGPAPADAGELDVSRLQPRTRGAAHEEREAAERATLGRQDGRKLRRTNRTETLSTKVRPETLQTIHRIAGTQGMTMVEVIEKAIANFERHLKGLPPIA